MNMQTYPEMNQTVKAILSLSDEPLNLYALARIEELENQVKEYQEKLKLMEGGEQA